MTADTDTADTTTTTAGDMAATSAAPTAPEGAPSPASAADAKEEGAAPDPEGRDLPTTPAQLLALFEELGITVETHRHRPVFTVEESQFLVDLLPGAHSKNLFLRNKKGESWLVTCEEERRIDIKALGALLGAGRLSFGSPERLWETLGVRPGSVTPFALVNDREARRVTFVIDAAMMRKSPLNFHPLINTMTCAISPADFLKFVAHCGHEAHIIDLDPAAPATP